MPLLLALASAPGAGADNLSLLSQNMHRLFDDVDDGNDEPVLTPARFRARVAVAVEKFGSEYSLPQVIALQEVENLNVVRQIATGLEERYATEYRAIMVSARDRSTINLAWLVRSDLSVRKSGALFGELRLAEDGGPLFSRPPLELDICYREQCLMLLNLHLRSMRAINDPERGSRVADKRRRQAHAVAAWANRYQHENPRAWLLMVGDFNALTPADRHVDVAGILRGEPDNSATRLPGLDLLEPNLIDLTRRIAAPQRYSFIYRGRRQQLDYAFANTALAPRLDSIRFGPIDHDFSDHAGLLARFHWP